MSAIQHHRNAHARTRPAARACAMLGAGLFLVAAVPAFGQGVDIPLIATAPEGAPNTWAAARFNHVFKTDLDKTGDVQRESVYATMGTRFEFAEDFHFTWQGAYSLDDYQIEGSPYFRFKEVHGFTLAAILGYTIGEDWRLIGGALFRGWGEGGADFDDALTGGGLIGFSYAATENLTLGAVIGIISQLEDPPSIIPLPTVDWRFAEGWKYHLGFMNVQRPGGGTEFTYDPNEEWQIGFGAAWETRRFRMDHRSATFIGPSLAQCATLSNGSCASDSNGIGQETSAPIFVRAMWRPDEEMSIGIMAGVQVAGELRVESRTGHRLREEDFDDPAPFVGIHANLLF